MRTKHGHNTRAHHQATCHAFNTIPNFFKVSFVTIVVRILVALGDNLVFLLLPAWNKLKMRLGVRSEVFFFSNLWEGL